VNPPLRTQIFYQVAHNKRPIVFLALIEARARKTHFGVGCWWLLVVVAVVDGCYWWLLVVVVGGGGGGVCNNSGGISGGFI
jgi:hypothetical protein